MEPSHLSHKLMVGVVDTSLCVGKLWVAFVYCLSVLCQIVPFSNADDDAIRAGAHLGDFVAVGYKVSAKVDTT